MCLHRQTGDNRCGHFLQGELQMNPYDIDIDELVESKEVTDEKELLKYQLAGEFLKITKKMSTQEILKKTGLDKSDLSRLRVVSVERYSIGKIIGLLSRLGYTAKVKVVKKAAS